MNNELLTMLTYMEKERGINRNVLIQAVEFALQSAAKKAFEMEQDPQVKIDPTTCDINVYAQVKVVEHPRSAEKEISLTAAKRIKPDVKLGDKVETKIEAKNFGRIAAQTAKQAIIQKIKQAERELVYDEYKDQVGSIVSGTIRQFNRSDIMVDLGRTEAVIPSKERVPTEEYQVGDRIRAYLLSVQNAIGGPSIVLSRNHPEFVKCMFKIEVSEIADGIVEIMGVAREPGYRTKIAVRSHDEKVDPVGACVGMRGIRVKNIVRELFGEKIDIIRWSADAKTYVQNALSPAKLAKISLDPEISNLVHVVADTDQLSLAIGKRGQNVRLTAKLVGMKIDIQKDESEISFEQKVAKAVDELAKIDGISRDSAGLLVKAGFLTLEGIMAADVADLEAAGLDSTTAKTIFEAAANAAPNSESAAAS